MKTLLLLCISALCSTVSHAQVSVSIKMDRSQCLANEPVTAVVTITNRSGRELSFMSKAEGSIAHSWLDFSMRDAGGRGMQKRHNKVFQQAVIPAGRSMARRVNLSGMFNVSRVSNYAVTAHVSQPGLDDTSYTSNSGHFTVGGGTTIYKQPFGVPKSKAQKREYKVITFNDGKKTSVYAQVMNLTTGQTLSTFRLSEFLSFVEPQMTLDGKNQLHILYLASPEVFVHATVNQNGGLVSTNYFKRVGGRKPRFVAFSDGKIVISGATPYDPKKAAQEAPRARSTSERPQ